MVPAQAAGPSSSSDPGGSGGGGGGEGQLCAEGQFKYSIAYARGAYRGIEPTDLARPTPPRNARSVEREALAHMAAAVGRRPLEWAPPSVARGHPRLSEACRRPAGSTRTEHGTVLGAKVRRLLVDLRALGEDKAVVFSASKAVVEHLELVLAREGLPRVALKKGDKERHLASAVDRWTRGEFRVLLLHADAAADGLTLTAAAHVFLMEPFYDRGKELQALNRCHRIGQSRDVVCKTYYCPNTVEERLLAWRELEGVRAPELGAEQQQGGEAEAVSVVPREKPLKAIGTEESRFLFGMKPLLCGDASAGASSAGEAGGA